MTIINKKLIIATLLFTTSISQYNYRRLAEEPLRWRHEAICQSFFKHDSTRPNRKQTTECIERNTVQHVNTAGKTETLVLHIGNT